MTIENYDFPGLITRGEVRTVVSFIKTENINEGEVILKRIIKIFLDFSLEY